MTDEDEALKAALTRVWDRAAATYDLAPGQGLVHADEWRAWRRLVAALLGDPSHSDVRPARVLDVGTGTGVLALLAAELGHDVTGFDRSAGMLAVARSKGAAAGLAVDWRLGDAEALDADLVAFDVVVGRHVLWTLPRPDRALASWRDAARAGGLVVVIDGISRPAPWPFEVAQRAARLSSSLASGSEAAFQDHAYPPGARARLPLASQRDLRPIVRLMREARLERVRVRPAAEVDRVERSHRPLLARLGDTRRRYVATGRTPILTAG
jgi:ubiquinone/menaquinone biosynthesis C-methylase UbiE